MELGQYSLQGVKVLPLYDNVMPVGVIAQFTSQFAKKGSALEPFMNWHVFQTYFWATTSQSRFLVSLTLLRDFKLPVEEVPESFRRR